MVHYLVTTGFSHTMETFLEHWGRDLAPRVRIMDYDKALRATRLPLGTYIFADLERLLPAELDIAEIVWNQLNSAGARLLNHPRRTFRRYDLLSKLHGLGRNDFRVARASERTTELRFPVFLRNEGDHGGSLTRLLYTHQEIDEALAGAMIRGHRMEHMLIVEFCNTVEKDGSFHKLAAFKVGDRIIPAHIDVSRDWLVKDTDIVSGDVLGNEQRFLESNPHRAWLEETFALAGVDYGRMDYGLLGDRPQVWEINTNPIVIQNPANYTEAHLPIKWVLTGMMVPAFEAIDLPETGTVPIDVPADLWTRRQAEKRREDCSHNRVRLIRRIKGSVPFRVFRRIVHPLLRPLAPVLVRTGGKSQPR